MTIPISPVMSPPVRNEILRGARWEKSFAGETTFAAMFVARVAMQRATIDRMRTAGLLKRTSTSRGSQMVSPKMTEVAEVTATPMNE